MVEFNGLPLFAATLTSEDDGIFRVSLVDMPAVESDFLVFAEMKPMQLFAVQDEDKHIVRGVIMRADYPIYRRDSNGEYYIVYKADTIREMAQRYLREGRQNRVNIMHEEGSEVSGVEMVQWFIKDTAAGIAPEGFDDIADGSLFAEYHIMRDDIWSAIKDGTFKGFSLEGYFGLTPIESNNQKNKKMSKINKIARAIIAEMVAQKFGTVTTDKGIIAWDDEGELAEGMEVYIVDEEGERTEAEDGEYATDTTVIVVADGKVSEIREIEQPAEEQPAEEQPASEAEPMEEEEPIAEAPAEAEPASPSAEERIAACEAEIVNLQNIISELVGRIEALEGAPAAEPAHDTFTKMEKADKTGNKGLDKALRIIGAR